MYSYRFNLSFQLNNIIFCITYNNPRVKNNNDIYNIAVIALKKLPDEGARNKFLNDFIGKLRTKDKPPHNTLGMLENLNKGNISQQLLDICPILKSMPRQKVYEDAHYQDGNFHRLSRTTNRCVKLEDGNIGFEGTDLKAESSLDEDKMKYLFGEQKSNYHQKTGDCWLVSQLKLIEILPKYKLEVYKRFAMDEDENIIYTLPNERNNKITIPKDVLKKYMEQTHKEHLSPAMACLSLLAAVFTDA